MNTVLNMKNVTRVVIERARTYKVESPMFTIEFKWDQSKTRSGEATFTKYIWNTNFRMPKVQNGAAVELDIKDVVAKCKEAGLEYKKVFANDPGQGAKVTLWSNNITKEQREEYEMTTDGIKIGTKGGKKNRRGSGTINWNDDTVETVVEPVVETVIEPTVEVVSKPVVPVVEETIEEKVKVSDMDIEQLKREIETELRAKLQEEAIEIAKKELKEELEAEVRQEVVAEMKAQLEKEMIEGIRAALVSEMKVQLRTSVRQELKVEIKNELDGASAEVTSTPDKKTINIVDNSSVIRTTPEIEYEVDDTEYEDDYEYVEPVVEEVVVTEEVITVSKRGKSKPSRRRESTPISFNDDSDELSSNDGFSEGFNWVE